MATPKPRVVLDTNIIISSLWGGNPRQIIDLWKEGRIALLVSLPVVKEYIAVLARFGLTDLTGWFMGHSILTINKYKAQNSVLVGHDIYYPGADGIDRPTFLVWSSGYTGGSREGVEDLSKEAFQHISCAPHTFSEDMQVRTSITADRAGFSMTTNPSEGVFVTQLFEAIKIGPYIAVKETATYATADDPGKSFEAAYTIYFKNVTPKEKIDCGRSGKDI